MRFARWPWRWLSRAEALGACRTRSGSGGYARPWLGGFAIAIGAAAPLPARADTQHPAVVLHELVLGASRSIDRHEIAALVLLVGLLLFAVVTAILLVRVRAGWARLEASSLDEIAALRADLDRANALLASEPQVMVDWPAAADEPNIEGDPAVVGVSAPHRVLAFGSWLDASKAVAMERAVEALRARGEPFLWRSRHSRATRSRLKAARSLDAPCCGSRMPAASSAICSNSPGAMRCCRTK